MSATRTQVYLTVDQRRRIDQITGEQGITMAEVIRRALDRYLGDEIEPSTALDLTFGADPKAEAPSRDQWRRG